MIVNLLVKKKEDVQALLTVPPVKTVRDVPIVPMEEVAEYVVVGRVQNITLHQRNQKELLLLPNNIMVVLLGKAYTMKVKSLQ